MQLGRKLAEGYAVDISEEVPAPDVTPEAPEPLYSVTVTSVVETSTEPAQV